MLSGHWRYAHIKAMRGDGVNLGLLAIDGTVSEDVVRQAMMRINQTQGLEWLNQQVVSDGEAEGWLAQATPWSGKIAVRPGTGNLFRTPVEDRTAVGAKAFATLMAEFP